MKYVLDFEVLMDHRHYRLRSPIRYYSKRYKKWIVVPKGFISDGATFAIDITTRAWWIHDLLCKENKFEDGTKCNRWQSSMILSDCLWEDDYRIQSILWFMPTLIAGIF